MAQKRKPDQSKLIAEAALDFAAKNGWSTLTMQAVAKKARLKTEAVTAVFPDKWAVLKWVIQDNSDQTDRIIEDSPGDSWRDNLFEILMTRVDLAAPHKKAFASLPRAFREDPKAALKFSRTFWRTMRHMLQLAKAPALPQHVAAFGVLYISVVNAFLKDDTRDHARTMAAVDKRLGYFERFAAFNLCDGN